MPTMAEIERYHSAGYKFCVDVNEIFKFCLASLIDWYLGDKIEGEKVDGRSKDRGGEFSTPDGQDEKQTSGQE